MQWIIIAFYCNAIEKYFAGQTSIVTAPKKSPTISNNSLKTKSASRKFIFRAGKFSRDKQYRHKQKNNNSGFSVIRW